MHVMAGFIFLLLLHAIELKIWEPLSLLLTTSLGVRKSAAACSGRKTNYGGAEGKKWRRRKKRYIIIVSDVFHSNAAHIKEGREGRKGKGKRGGKKRKNNINISVVPRFKVNAAICILNFEKKI